MGRITDSHAYDDGAEVQNLQLEPLAADPATPRAGRLWWDSVNGVPRYGDGTNGNPLGSGGMGLNLEGGDPTGATESSTELQAGLDAAVTAGERLILPEGTFLVRDLAAGVVGSTLSIVGQGRDRTRLLLEPTASAILRCTDIKHLRLAGITFDANAGVGTGGLRTGNNNMLVNFVTTAVTVGSHDFTVDIDNCLFTGHSSPQADNNQAQGHLTIRIHEVSPTTNETEADWSSFERISVRNTRFEFYGFAHDGQPVYVRGPGKLCRFEGCSERNDGQYGFRASGGEYGTI